MSTVRILMSCQKWMKNDHQTEFPLMKRISILCPSKSEQNEAERPKHKDDQGKIRLSEHDKKKKSNNCIKNTAIGGVGGHSSRAV